MSPIRTRGILLALCFFAAAPLHAQPATAGYPVSSTHLGGEVRPSVLADGLGGAFIGYKLAYRGPSLPEEVLVSHVLASGARYPEWETLPLAPAGSLDLASPPGPARVLVAPSGKVLAFADVGSASGVDIVRQFGADGGDPGYPGFKPTYDYTVLTVAPRSDGGAFVLSKVFGSTNCLATVLTPTGSGTEVLNQLNVGNHINMGINGPDQMAAVPSGTNGAIVAIQFPQIQLDIAGGSDIVAVRIDATGHTVWTPAHRVVTQLLRDQVDVVATSDGADGIIMAWRDMRTGANGADVYAERMLSTGAIATGWTGGGKAVAALVGSNQFSPVIASDGAGGAWFAWPDDRNLMANDLDVYFTHVLANGTFAAGFPTGGKGLCVQGGTQTGVRIAPDGSGGLFAVWLDTRDGEQDLYGQHLDSAGNITAGWLANGTPLCTEGTPQIDAAIGAVSNGRAIVAWSDQRSGSDAVYSLTLDAVKGALAVPPVAVGRLALAPRANPAHGGIELALEAGETGEVRVELLDVAGRVLARQMVAGPGRAISVRFTGVRPGLYFVTAAGRSGRASARVAVLN